MSCVVSRAGTVNSGTSRLQQQLRDTRDCRLSKYAQAAMIATMVRHANTPAVGVPVTPARGSTTAARASARVAENVGTDWRDLIVRFQPHKQAQVCADLCLG